LEKDIEKLSNFVKPKEEETEIFNAIFPISIGVFWKRFLANNAEYSCKDFYTDEGHKDIKISDWEPDYKKGMTVNCDNILGGTKEHLDTSIDSILDPKVRKILRSIFMTIKVKGIPLHSKTL